MDGNFKKEIRKKVFRNEGKKNKCVACISYYFHVVVVIIIVVE